MRNTLLIRYVDAMYASRSEDNMAKEIQLFTVLISRHANLDRYGTVRYGIEYRENAST